MPFDDDALGHSTSGRLARPTQRIGEDLETQDEQARILKSMGALPDKYRLVITLRYVRKMSYKDIADHLGEPGQPRVQVLLQTGEVSLAVGDLVTAVVVASEGADLVADLVPAGEVARRAGDRG